MATISDHSDRLAAPIPFVEPARVRLAARAVERRLGAESARDVLAMLGITPDSLRDGLGVAP